MALEVSQDVSAVLSEADESTSTGLPSGAAESSPAPAMSRPLKLLWVTDAAGLEGGLATASPAAKYAARQAAIDVAPSMATSEAWEAIVCDVGGEDEWSKAIEISSAARKFTKSAFIVLNGAHVADSAARRWQSFEKGGVNMVTNDSSALSTVLDLLAAHLAAADVNVVEGRPTSKAGCKCPYCAALLPAEVLWEHMPLFHVHQRNLACTCPICKERTGNIQVHVHEKHRPPWRKAEPEDGIEAVVIVVRGRCSTREPWRYLLVHEFAGLGFWTPGGLAHRGEDVCDAAHRETLEEAGIEVKLEGIINIEDHPPWLPGVSRRVLFLAGLPLPVERLPTPKSIPDFESTGAVWATKEEMKSLKLRAPEPFMCARHLEAGGEVYPLEFL